MRDKHPNLNVIEGALGQENDETLPATPVTAPITPPRNYENWKRKSFSEGLMEAFHRLGGIDYLTWFGREYPADFVRACSRMIPREIRDDLSSEVTIIHAALPRTQLDLTPPSEEGPNANRIKFIERSDEDT